ncbi:MAG: bifunctional 3-phosphoshikimate 1-carboxyvinyltransferase/cytidylate kinase [Variovorax sp.]
MFRTPFIDIPPLIAAAGTVRLPGSKSISNRVLLLAALAQGNTVVHDLLDSDDTRVMLEALDQLGAHIERLEGGALRINGLDGQLPVPLLSSSSRTLAPAPAPAPGSASASASTPAERLFLGNAGTAMRPLTAALALLGGNFELRGVARMHERPIADLVGALRQLGACIDYLENDGYPPLRIRPVAPDALRLDAPVRVRGDVSSQFLTALLLALPLVARDRPVVIEVVGELISKPYVEITLNLLARFGVAVERAGWQRFTIPAGSRYLAPDEIHVEADASSASYFIAAGAIAATAAAPLRIEGVGTDSIQGDIRFVDAALRMGAHVESGPNWLQVSRSPDLANTPISSRNTVGIDNAMVDVGATVRSPLRAIELDCNHIPDAAMTLAVMALYADGPSLLSNIASWRVKETDRIDAMASELRKLGARVEAGADFIRIWPLATDAWRAATIATYDDHRVAMCFALAAFNPARLPQRIIDPACVAKTFPDYFETLFNVAVPARGRVPVICIDGPTASGKGTLAAALARQLGYHYLDSGALYRATGLAMRRHCLAPDAASEEGIAAVAAALPLIFDGERIILGGEDVSEAIRTEAAGMDASQVSALPSVRSALRALQEGFRRLPGLVADGRDMGSVIFPDAALKVYLTANARQRAERRHKQLISKGIPATIAGLLADLEARDARDSSRTVAPLSATPDARLLDNSELSIEQSVQQVLRWWQEMRPFE